MPITIHIYFDRKTFKLIISLCIQNSRNLKEDFEQSFQTYRKDIFNLTREVFSKDIPEQQY